MNRIDAFFRVHKRTKKSIVSPLTKQPRYHGTVFSTYFLLSHYRNCYVLLATKQSKEGYRAARG